MDEDDHTNRRHSKVGMHLPIKGMESVIATVSGYHGTERFNLIKLIDKSGASYVGSMNQWTTHLVCWRFNGKKYEFAKKFKMSIVNHQWIEDCIKEGRRLPEAPYTFQCGQEVGPLMLDITLLRTTKQLNHSKKPVIHIESEEDVSWKDSTLLKENLSPELGKYKDRPRGRSNDGILNQDHLSSRRYFSDEHSSRGSCRTEIEELNFPSPAFLKSKKRGSDLAGTSSKGRRLVKKNIGADFVEIISDSEKQSHQIQALREQETSSQIYGLDVERPEISVSRHASSFSCYQAESNRVGVDGNCTEDAEVQFLNNVDQMLHVEGASSNLTGSQQEKCTAIDEVQNETDNTCKVSKSTELSCVICWTDFSSSRGVLPCGHRFCFSCIQTWADHRASSGKASTCPLCKASFIAITKFDDAIPADQKIYSQTIPDNNSGMNLYIIPEVEKSRFPSNPSRSPVCCECSCREPEDLLVKCHICDTRCIHSYCLDPPLFPWTCTSCKDLQRLHRGSW